MLKKLLDLLTGGLGGTATGAVVGIAQFAALAGMVGAAWLWVFDNKDRCFAYCGTGILVSDLLVIVGLLGFCVLIVWLAGRGRPQ